MSLDTKYRPMVYADVIGQQSNVEVLTNIIKKGAGFHQSYVFCGRMVRVRQHLGGY